MAQFELEFERLHPLKVRDENDLHLVCFPPLGGGFFNFVEWVDPTADGCIAIPENISLWAFEFGWRDEWTYASLIRALVDAMEAKLPLQPFALFGFSFGGLLAADAARTLCQGETRRPIGLAIGGMCAPSLYHPATDYATDAEWRHELERVGGTPRDVLDDPAQLRHLVRELRGGLRIARTYRPQEGTFDFPIAVFSGRQDPEFPPESVYAWHKLTTREFGAHTFSDAGHLDVLQMPHLRACFLAHLVATIRGWQGRTA